MIPVKIDISKKPELEPEFALSALQTAWQGSDEAAVKTPDMGGANPDELASLGRAVAVDAGVSPPPAAQKIRRASFLDLRAVPQISEQDAARVFPMMNPGFPGEWKEQIRQLRTRLNGLQAESAMQEQELQIVAITNLRAGSPRHGMAANLALTMSSMRDMRVLVVDAKLSTADMHMLLGESTGAGLCEASRASREDLPASFRRITGTQIYLMPGGDASAHPLDPLDLRGVHAMLQSLRPQFDWILLDCPSFDSPSDAMAMSMFADGTLMLVEREQDGFEAMERALGQVQGKRLLGAVIV